VKLNFIKNYFYIFAITYIMSITTKFIFVYYLYDNFSEFNISTLIYAVFWGYKFDFATSGVIAFLATLFDFNKKIFSRLGAVLIVSVFFMQVGDILYFNESSRHIGYEIMDIFVDAKSLFMTAYSQHTLLTILSIIIGMILFYLLSKYLSKLETIKWSRYYLVNKLILIALTVLFIRGLFQHIPLTPWQSNQIGETKLATLALNPAYNIIYSLVNHKKKLEKIKLATDTENILKVFSTLYSEHNKSTHLPLFKEKPNIVFFYLESWSGVNIKSYGFPHDTTPFLNEILTKSIRPKGMIASGHRTTEGIFASLTSFQNPLGKSVAQTQLQNFDYPSIINILNKNSSYSSAFFQGTSKETSGTGSLAQSLGFANSYGKRDIDKHIYEWNHWGLHDVDLYNFTLEKLESMKKPFVIGINGATTHDEKIPSQIKKIHFVDDESYNNQLNALHFADLALKEFVLSVQKEYPNTLFVFFADHCGGVKGSSFENYLIPFALYHKDLEAKFYDTYLSQRDIAPIIYDMIYGDYKKSHINFSGKSIFSDKEFFADYYHNGILGWVEGDFILEINTITNKYKCFEIVNFKDKEIACRDDIVAFRDKAIAFTELSQTLLFDGELDKFKEYRYR